MKTTIISTKEIRSDLEGFLQKLKQGQTVQVLYRSKLLVTLVAKEESDSFLNSNAGTPAGALHSIDFAQSLSGRQPVFDSSKSFKELYNDTQTV